MSIATAEISRAKKVGLQRSAQLATGSGLGTQAPGEGFAMSIAHRQVAKLDFEHDHDRHDVEVGLGLVAAKRASLVGRGPQLSDVLVAMKLFGLEPERRVEHHDVTAFAGLAHSYVAQRRFVDAVSKEDLLAVHAEATHS